MAPPGDNTLTSLVARRADLLARRVAGPELDEVTDQVLERFTASAPSVRRVDRSETALVEWLVAHEPVHPFAGPRDVDHRFVGDRRCYVLEHPDLPEQPLNAVFVALVDEIPSNIDDVLDTAAAPVHTDDATTATLYSIWNASPGARGLDGGRMLIDGVVAHLCRELPHLDTFATLSPIPGFRRWASDGGWPEELDADHPALVGACAQYLTTVVDGRPLDAVAGFHLGNGARLLDLHRHADASERGERRSWGVMANYRYLPEDRAANRAALTEGQPAVGATVAELLGSALITPTAR
ncbi:MAG: malonyl-CoA decarboxylase domain-containing protein [Actinomycetes bacterium]